MLTAGFIDQVAVRKDLVEKSTKTGKIFASSRGVPYKALGVSENIFIHPSFIFRYIGAGAARPDRDLIPYFTPIKCCVSRDYTDRSALHQKLVH